MTLCSSTLFDLDNDDNGYCDDNVSCFPFGWAAEEEKARMLYVYM